VNQRSIHTDILEIAFEDGGPEQGPPALLLHGWPDAPRGWTGVASSLQARGWRTIVPYLRGFGPTRFRSPSTPRIGAAVAMTQDAIDLADALDLERFAVVGHDWGARIAYTLAALFPERVTAVAAMALGYQPRGGFRVPDFAQSKRFWYQWFMCIEEGANAVRKDPVGFARIQWDSWSPPGWFDEREFLATAASFTNPDWVSVTLNAYRARWLPNEIADVRYGELQERLGMVERLSVPTLMIQGAADNCDSPKESEHLEGYFTAKYDRHVLEGVGHFPHREAPAVVAAAVLHHLSAVL
jgi:pimeloyl-ACP methyl ester carboxylesterase